MTYFFNRDTEKESPDSIVEKSSGEEDRHILTKKEEEDIAKRF